MITFNLVEAGITRAHASGDFAGALRLAREGHNPSIDERVRTRYWQARLESLLGDAAAALAALEAGLEEGGWFNPESLASDPDLAALRGLPAVTRILRECRQRRELRRAAGRPLCLVLSPSSALWDQQTLLVLHRRGDSARQTVDLWRPLVDEGWTLVVPQSSQPWDSAGWCWDEREIALREVRAHLEECRTRRGLDPSRLVAVGVSDGASLATDIAGEAGLPWLCVIPVFPSGFDVTALAAVPRHARGAFLIGENDPMNVRTRQVVDILDSAGASVAVRTMAGVGHELPADLGRHATLVLESLELG